MGAKHGKFEEDTMEEFEVSLGHMEVRGERASTN